MKVVINVCFGGFSLSARAFARIAELRGRECYFFTHQTKPTYDFEVFVPITLQQADSKETFIFSAYDIPNPTEVIGKSFRDEDGTYKTYNARYEKHALTSRDLERHDPLLIQVVEELGDAANGQHAKLRVVEIPDGVEYEIEEYDGNEHVAETHRTWR